MAAGPDVYRDRRERDTAARPVAPARHAPRERSPGRSPPRVPDRARRQARCRRAPRREQPCQPRTARRARPRPSRPYRRTRPRPRPDGRHPDLPDRPACPRTRSLPGDPGGRRPAAPDRNPPAGGIRSRRTRRRHRTAENLCDHQHGPCGRTGDESRPGRSGRTRARTEANVPRQAGEPARADNAGHRHDVRRVRQPAVGAGGHRPFLVATVLRLRRPGAAVSGRSRPQSGRADSCRCGLRRLLIPCPAPGSGREKGVESGRAARGRREGGGPDRGGNAARIISAPAGSGSRRVAGIRPGNLPVVRLARTGHPVGVGGPAAAQAGPVPAGPLRRLWSHIRQSPADGRRHRFLRTWLLVRP